MALTHLTLTDLPAITHWRRLLLVGFIGAAAAQVGAQPSMTDSTPSATPLLTDSQLRSRMAWVGDATPPVHLLLAKMPFPVDKNYPSFYVIPAALRVQVLDQSQCGSCVAYATAGALSGVLGKTGLAPNTINPHMMTLDPLPFFLGAGRVCTDIPDPMKIFSSGHYLAGPGGDKSKANSAQATWWAESGWGVETAARRLATDGANMANIMGTPSGNSTATVAIAGMRVQIGHYGVFSDNEAAKLPGGVTRQDAMRKFLVNHGAIATWMQVFPTLSHYKGGVYDHAEFVGKILANLQPKPGASATDLQVLKAMRDAMSGALNTVTGGHALTIIGYHTGGRLTMGDLFSIAYQPGTPVMPAAMAAAPIDMPPFWIVQNSWGKNWGANGYILMKAGQPNGVDADDHAVWMTDPVVTSMGQPLKPPAAATAIAAAPAPAAVPAAATATATATAPVAPAAAGIAAPPPLGTPLVLRNVFRKEQQIHIETGQVQSGPAKPGWLSAQWQLEVVPGTAFVRIKNMWKGTYLNAESGALGVAAVQPGVRTAHWLMEPVPGSAGEVRIRNAVTGTYLHTETGTLSLGEAQPGWISARWSLR